ncbi:MAG TPA: class I SAM-dependent methyltransferase, partial [Anaerolineaceae bacterium]|nr:class I SAM-dependent methyltransferase [Anaerolineaceae bacterium]
LEGDTRWVIELFGDTLVINDHLQTEPDPQDAEIIAQYYMDWLPAIKSVLLKQRYASQRDHRHGKIIFGEKITTQVKEFSIRYAINLQLNQDSSFYFDTRYLRSWLQENMEGKSVLNTFAYTGSLGIAALAAGAEEVIQIDLNRRFLDLALLSCRLNDQPVQKMKLIANDFYRAIGNFKRTQKLFDCVILDPPFFSKTTAGRVDLVNESSRLINKARPLVGHKGWLIFVNNALFFRGQEFIDLLEELCQDQYIAIDSIIPVPQDITGYPDTIVSQPPVSVEPFNHSTKIVVLRVNRKDERPASKEINI